MNKKWVLIIIGILLFAGIIGTVGIGGKVFMDKKQAEKEQRQEAEKIEAERMSVLALKNTFEGIKSVEFEKNAYNAMTGSYSMIVKMTNINGEFVRFDYMFTKNRPNTIGGWGVIDEEKVQIEGETETKVDVIYTNGNEDEL